MKRLIASIVILLLFASYLLSCEKDDLCAEGTPTTPHLVVGFYKDGEVDVPYSVTDFQYYVPGTDSIMKISGNKVLLPLRTDKDEVTWALQYNYSVGSTKITNTDLLTVKYTRKDTYVSRACGFKTTFTLLPEVPGIPNPTISDSELNDDGLFIKANEVVTRNIETEDEVHVKIYF